MRDWFVRHHRAECGQLFWRAAPEVEVRHQPGDYVYADDVRHHAVGVRLARRHNDPQRVEEAKASEDRCDHMQQDISILSLREVADEGDVAKDVHEHDSNRADRAGEAIEPGRAWAEPRSTRQAN